MIHLDCDHSKGFAAPGPRSTAKGVTNISSNAVEGAHGALYKLIRQWMGCKIGRGSEEHEELVKDTALALLNWSWQLMDGMQQLFLWMRL